ncbi:unnamed protein product [Pleuronectes platessa]|uniref:Uncharacterized protein n=1 Tax=Pleuronectes platessa TaxID=8262 RepID=A0A9N7Z184_PLEPL|nr:unnamed protein product [Pleuronectes platessa]
MQTRILESENDSQLKVSVMESQLLSQQSENVVCFQKIKELESLVETTEDLQKSVELNEKLTARQIHQLEYDSDLKLKTLEVQVRSEQAMKETYLQIIKELKSLVEATKKKLLDVQEDSQHRVQKMEEDIKFLIKKTIKLQELALMSDSDKARRSENERKAQKEEEKRVKKELKEKKKQEKIKKEQIEKEMKEKNKKQEKTEKEQREKEIKEKKKQGKIEKEQREMDLKEKKKQEKTEKKEREKEAKKEKRKTTSQLPSPC